MDYPNNDLEKDNEYPREADSLLHDYREFNRELKSAINYQLIGKRMQHARLQKNLTQAAVAEQMHLGEKYYASLESGKLCINLVRFIQFICIMQVSADQLLAGCFPDYPSSDNCDDITEQRHQVNQLLDQCSDDMLQTIYAVVKGLIQYG